MFAATRRWVRRNRTPFAVAVGVVGVGYVATQYVLNKISEARERMSSDRIARENLRRRFEQNQEDCTYTVLALLPTATENIVAALETERITFELQQQKAARLAKGGDGGVSEMGSSPPSLTDDDGRSITSTNLQSESGMHISRLGIPTADATTGSGVQDGGQQAAKARKSKLQLWNDLKISAITRAFTLIYTLALLTLLTRIQLNLLGRRSYLSSVVSLASGGPENSTISLENNDDDNDDQTYGNDLETNRRYLTFSWWLLHRGWKDLMHKVEAAVTEIFGPLSPRDDISMTRFSELTLEVRKKIEGTTEAERSQQQWLEFLLPPQEQEEYVLNESGMIGSLQREPRSGPLISKSLRRLLDETADLIDSPPFTHVLTLLLDAGYSTLVDNKIASQAYKIPSDTLSTSAPQITELIDPGPVKLPVVLATLSRQAHSIGNGMPNEYLQSMEAVRDLEAFAAVVYSSNWENDMVPFDDEEAGLTAETAKRVAHDVKEKATAVAQKVTTRMPDISKDDLQKAAGDVIDNSKVIAEQALDKGKGLAAELTEKSKEVAQQVEGGTESLIDVTKSTFESAWGKATESVKGDSESQGPVVQT